MQKLHGLFLTFFLSVVFCLNAQVHHPYVSEDVWKLIEPYLLPDNHPLKKQLDHMFLKKRLLQDTNTLFKAGFNKVKPQPHTKLIVTKHKRFKGYIFKLYTDDKSSYYRDEPEYITWMLRARGAKLLRREIAKQGWGQFFKAPMKWIYALPALPRARKGDLQKNFILVEEEMDILSNRQCEKKWQNGTITPDILDKLFYLVTTTGLRGGCKYDNIPICKDGRIAFIDTQNNLRWPLPYDRLFQVLTGSLRTRWEELMKTESQIPRITE